VPGRTRIARARNDVSRPQHEKKKEGRKEGRKEGFDQEEL
jgi:hypothetical protein